MENAQTRSFYDIVKLCKGGLSLNLPAFDSSSNNKQVRIPYDINKVRVSRVHALGIFTDSALEKMYKQGYFRVEPVAEFEKDVASCLSPVENKIEVASDDVIIGYLTKGNRAAIKKLIEEGGIVNKDKIIVLARENIGQLSTTMVKDLEKILSIELIIENEDINE